MKRRIQTLCAIVGLLLVAQGFSQEDKKEENNLKLYTPSKLLKKGD